MRRFYGVLGALALVLLPVYAAGQTAKPATTDAKTQKAAPAGKSMTMTGTVSAVTGDALTIKGKTDETTFKVGTTTKVVGAGASHKSAELKGQEKPTVITDFVKVGDNVSVTYHEMGGEKMATNVRVRATKAVK